MKIKRLIVFAGVIMLIVGMISVLPIYEKKSVNNSRNVQPLETVPAPYQSQMKTNATMITLDSIASGNELKARLNNHSAIKIIQHNEKDQSHYYKNQVTVKFQKIPTKQELTKMEKDIDGKIMKQMNHIFMFQSESKTAEELKDYFENIQHVEYAEPNYIYLQNEVPNDLLYLRYQWNLPAIQTEEGWRLSQGNENVVIAVIDSGVDLDHPDLVHRLKKGYNVLANNDLPEDDNGHGTHVAGIIASETNNREGVAGITWFNHIMPIKALNSEGYGSSFDVAKGIIWAVDHGARIINLSLGNYQPSELLQEAVRYAYERGVVIIAASGNDNSSQPSYPAAYHEVLSVGAINPDGSRAEFSNYGNYLDVVAPGTGIPSTFVHHRYAALSGTSMAAPHVTALAGLILSLNPELSNIEVMNIINRSTVDLGTPGNDPFFGNGLINIYNAMQLASKRNETTNTQ
jgi:thermitase